MLKSAVITYVKVADLANFAPYSLQILKIHSHLTYKGTEAVKAKSASFSPFIMKQSVNQSRRVNNIESRVRRAFISKIPYIIPS